MPDTSEVERQLAAFAATLEHETGEPIRPTQEVSPHETGRSGPGRRRSRILVAVAASLVAVLAGVVLFSREPQQDRVDDQPGIGSIAPVPSTDAPTTTEGGVDAAAEVSVSNRHPVAVEAGMRLFPSPDGRVYLDSSGCVGAIDDEVTSCPDEEVFVASASWSADSSIAVFDNGADVFQLGNNESSVFAAFIQPRNADSSDGNRTVRFDKLTGDEGTGIDFMPLVVDEQIRFLRLDPESPTASLELVTIDLDGNVTSSASTMLQTSDLARLDALLVQDRYGALVRVSEGQNQLVTIDRDGTATNHPIASASVGGLWGTSGRVAVTAFDDDTDPPSAQILVFDGTDYETTGLDGLVESPDGPDATVGAAPVAFSPDGDRIVVAYPISDAESLLRVWNRTDETIIDIGIAPTADISTIRWPINDRIVVFGQKEILELETGDS